MFRSRAIRRYRRERAFCNRSLAPASLPRRAKNPPPALPFEPLLEGRGERRTLTLRRTVFITIVSFPKNN
jgi:hypothetical protein